MVNIIKHNMKTTASFVLSCNLYDYVSVVQLLKPDNVSDVLEFPSESEGR